MKLFVFTDSHGKASIINKLKKSNADLFICLGDFTLFGSNQKKILKDFNSLNKKMILIHGNHESWTEIKNDVKNLKNIIFLYRNIHRHENILFAGYGGGGFSFKEKFFKHLEKEVKKNLKKDDNIILLTHGPPYGTKLDLIDGIHIGCEDYTHFIKKYHPKYAFSGHIHENANIKDFKHKTILINPGSKGVEIIL